MNKDDLMFALYILALLVFVLAVSHGLVYLNDLVMSGSFEFDLIFPEGY